MPQREGFGIRLGAYLIDFLIMVVVLTGLVSMILLGSFNVSFGTAGGTGAGTATTVSAGTLQLVAILGPLFGLAYASLEIFLGRSVGKMALGLIIRSEHGAPAPVPQLATRWAIKYSPSLIALLAGITGIGALGYVSNAASLVILIGCFMVLGEKKQAIHDMIAKTAVFKLVPRPVQGFQPIMPGQPMPEQPYPPPGQPYAPPGQYPPPPQQ